MCAENCDDIKYDGETTLTIITTRKPISLLKIEKYRFEQITPWKYKSHYDEDELEIYIIVLREMRGLEEGEGMALLQVFEGEKEKQVQCWKALLNQNLQNAEKLKKIMEKISKEALMNIIQEAKIEEKREIAIEMLKDHMPIEQIVKFTKLAKDEVLKLKNERG